MVQSAIIVLDWILEIWLEYTNPVLFQFSLIRKIAKYSFLTSCAESFVSKL